MGKLLYLMTTSLDGYAADEQGEFEWAAPSEEVHAFINEQVRTVGTILMGRKLYETMKVWEDIPTEGVSGPYMDGPSLAMNEYASIWRGANKVVYSTTLSDVSIANTTIERSFNLDDVRQMVTDSERDVDIGGPNLAGQAIRAGMVDEYHQIVVPVLVGGGTLWLPQGAQAELELLETRKFENGSVYLHYRKKS
jgi:dihydrofolate reductase